MYYAHYDHEQGTRQTLHEHLHAVADMMANALSPAVRFRSISHHDLISLVRWIGLLHDFGKYTPFFQEYLLDGKETRLKSHAHISACFLYRLLMKELDGKMSEQEKHIWSFIAYLVVRHHHGSLTLSHLFSSRDIWNVLQQQAETLLQQKDAVLDDIGLGEQLDATMYDDCLRIEELKNDRKFFYYMPQYLSNRMKCDRWYFVLVFLFSLLIDADKLDSSGVKPRKNEVTSPERVEDYLVTKHGTACETGTYQERRNEVRQKVLRVIDGMSDEAFHAQRIYTLTAPTGIGKTLTALQCALRMQERIYQTEGYIPRIIAALPFINIIEQTKKDYEGVFGSERVLAHHRLNDYTARKKDDLQEDEHIPIDRIMTEVESWESDVIVTTFVQFFHSIVTGQNRPLKKLNKLAGSIVILDEVQSLPEVYMPLAGALLRKIAEYYGTRFILMTATQPKIMELGDRLLGKNGQTPVELLPDHEQYFRELKRTKLVPLLSKKVTSESLVEEILAKQSPYRSVLIVVNTIRRSIDLYEKLRDRHREGRIGQDVTIHYLSTNIIPKHRREVVRQVKDKLTKGQPVYLVSTQTIEAGVDLDFDMGIRDLAPMESIIQTAGRINREGKKKEFSPLYIVRLENDSQYVYKKHHLDRTEKLLQMKDVFMEPDYRGLVEEYYRELLEAGVSEESRQLWEQGIMGLDFEKLKEFQLIEQMGEVVDVFIELDETASLLADAFEELTDDSREAKALREVFPDWKKRNKPSFYERRHLKRLVMGKMSEYLIQIRIKHTVSNLPLKFETRNGVKASFFWVPPNQVHDYYDFVTGFKDKTGEAYIV